MGLPDHLQSERDREIALVEQFSFELPQLGLHLKADETAMKIIRAQLYIEHVLSGIVGDALIDPSAVDLNKLGFGTKLGLAIGLGILPKTLRPVVVRINDLRNEMSHSLIFSMPEMEKDRLWHLLPNELREATLDQEVQTTPEKVTLSRIFISLVIFMDVCRQRAAAFRIDRKYAAINLGRIIDKIEREG